MKTTVLISAVALMVLAACGGGGAGNPEDAVTDMFDALQAGDGERAVSYMSSSALEAMDTQLEMIKTDPETAAAQLAAMGIEIDASEIPDMTAAQFTAHMLSTPLVTSIMASAEVTIGEVTIDGDIAKVEVTTTVMGESETNVIDVVMEDGQWKVTEFGMNF